VTGSAGLRRPSLLTKRSRRRGRDRFFSCRRLNDLASVAMPFDEEDESPLVGMLPTDASPAHALRQSGDGQVPVERSDRL
jgi:hypothetical protein